MNKNSFIITIDVEGDNLWSKPKLITTHNDACLQRFQLLCEKFQFRPTYLCNYEMLQSPVFIEFANRILESNSGEIGMHLHSWNTPPFYKTIDSATDCLPYLIEYPEEIIRAKINYLTELFQQRLQIKPLSHRAGRWALNEIYIKCLQDAGYKTDCSVTPLISWKSMPGFKEGGTDYSNFNKNPYFIDTSNIKEATQNGMLEVPMTIIEQEKQTKTTASKSSLIKKIFSAGTAPKSVTTPLWLRPSGNNLESMKWIIDQCVLKKTGYAMFMLHSSELMPAGSPTFADGESIEKLYKDMEVLFAYASESFTGATLNEYHDKFIQGILK